MKEKATKKPVVKEEEPGIKEKNSREYVGEENNCYCSACPLVLGFFFLPLSS